MDSPRPSGPQRPDPLETEPGEADWLEREPPTVSPDFVERTLQGVLDDQREIAAEAARVDEIQLPGELLAAYAVPEPSPDFVGRVGDAVSRQQVSRQQVSRGQVSRGQGSPDLADALPAYRVPEPSPEFVERTLRALSIDRPARLGRIRRGPWLFVGAIAAAAAVLLVALLNWPSAGGPKNLAEATAAVWAPESAQSYSPSPLAAVMSGVIAGEDAGALALGGPDGLGLLLRAEVAGR